MMGVMKLTRTRVVVVIVCPSRGYLIESSSQKKPRCEAVTNSSKNRTIKPTETYEEETNSVRVLLKWETQNVLGEGSKNTSQAEKKQNER